MRLREFSTPKSASKSVPKNAIEAEAMQKPRALNNTGNPSQNHQRTKPCELRTARAAGHCATRVASALKNDA
jgi:hypothetical protein